MEGFVQDHMAARPHQAVSAGLHEHDGRLPDWSRSGLRSERRRLREARNRASSFPPDDLDPKRRLERSYLLAQVDRELFWLETAESPRRNPYFYIDALSPQTYLGRRYAPAAERMRAFIRYARNVPEAVEQIRSNLEPPLPESYVVLTRESFGGLAEYLDSGVQGAFAEVESGELRRELQEATGSAAAALRELVSWLEASGRAPASEFTLEESGLAEMLRSTEGVELAPSRLRALGEEELERNQAALREACGRMEPGLPIEACVRRLRSDKPSRAPVDEARHQVERMRRFVEERELVTVPAGGEARVEVSPPHLRWNAALVDIPGPADDHLPAVFFIAPPDPAWSEEEREAYQPSRVDLLFISLHEVWPGHYLHFLHAHRSESLLARHFVGYGFAEGWAHYAEELCWEAGLEDETPEAEAGLRLSALLRNVRLLVALGLHAGEMTVREAEEAFRRDAFQDAATARQQAARGTFDPGYLNYTLGKMVMKKLRRDWEEQVGDGGWKAFHDRLLGLGGPPLGLAREALLPDPGGRLI